MTPESHFLRFRATGEREELARALELVAQKLMSVALRRTRNHEEACDLVQATFATAIESAHKYGAKASLLAWLRGILLNHDRQLRRTRDRQRARSPRKFDGTGEPDPCEATHRKLLLEQIRQRVQELPQPYREVLDLYFGEGWDSAQIASHLHRPHSTVRTQLSRGLERLKKGLPPGLAIGIIVYAAVRKAPEQVGPGLSNAAGTAPRALAAGTAVLAVTAATLFLNGWAGRRFEVVPDRDPVVANQTQEPPVAADLDEPDTLEESETIEAENNKTLVPPVVPRSSAQLVMPCSPPVVPRGPTFDVSPKHATSDAPGLEQFAGLCKDDLRVRQQILLAERRLAGLRSKYLTGMMLRRDAQVEDAWQGGFAMLEVRFCRGPSSPAMASHLFSQNQRSSPQTVFWGTVVIPDSPRVKRTGYDPWGPKNAFYVKFTTAYRYEGGSLCIDIIGTSSAATGTPFWMVDHEYEEPSGKVIDFGTGCVARGSRVAFALACERGLRIGNTLAISAMGRENTSALLAMGISKYQDPSPLPGATDCFLYFKNELVIPVGSYIYYPQLQTGLVGISIELPLSKRLLGSHCIVQFINLENALPRRFWSNSAGMTTSNGLDLTVCSKPPTLGMSVVRSHQVRPDEKLPASGAVDLYVGPVIRFTYEN